MTDQVQFNCGASYTLFCSTKVSSDNWYPENDEGRCNYIYEGDEAQMIEDFERDHHTPCQLLKEYAELLRNQLRRDMPSHKKAELNQKISDCEMWEEYLELIDID